MSATPSYAAPMPRSRAVGIVATEPSIRVRLRARIMANRLDRQVEAGVWIQPKSALAAHTSRLTSRRERNTLARLLTEILDRADNPNSRRSSHVPLDRCNVDGARSLLETIIERLQSTAHVRPRGVARLRLLLADGTSPLYSGGRGTLSAPLQGVLVAL